MNIFKRHRILCLLLFLLLLVGCATEDNIGASVMVEGDLAYFSDMSPEEREERCKDKIVQVSGVVSYVGRSLLYIGDRIDGGITVVCYLSDETAADFVKAGDYVTVRGTCTTCLETNITMSHCLLIGIADLEVTDHEETSRNPDTTESVETERDIEAETTPGGERLVWIPTKGGTKYHTKADCSNMQGPRQVTLEEAVSEGFTACKRCH